MENIKFRWISSDWSPTVTEASIIYCTTNGKLGILKNTEKTIDEATESDWKTLKEKLNIKYWAYQNQIKPKEFKI